MRILASHNRLQSEQSAYVLTAQRETVCIVHVQELEANEEYVEREDEFDVNERPASPAADECAQTKCHCNKTGIVQDVQDDGMCLTSPSAHFRGLRPSAARAAT